MSRPARLLVLTGALAALGVLLVLAFTGLPPFGTSHHPYRDLAVRTAVAKATANVVSAVNFDQRGLDTLGEESILLGSVLAAAALLRPSPEERERGLAPAGRVLDATRIGGYVLLPVTLILGVDVVAHGHLTPGGGFQGGVVLATGLHLLYVSGTYQALERARPLVVFRVADAVGAAAFAGLGIATLLASGAFLANVLATGRFGALLSAGTVPLLNGAVGLEVASGVIVLLAQFLQQALTLEASG